MKKWYLYYTKRGDCKIIQQFIEEIYSPKNQKDIILYQLGRELQDKKMHQHGAEFPLPFALVP
jgi:hypothetical protein